jgi:hypothetical protein
MTTAKSVIAIDGAVAPRRGVLARWHDVPLDASAVLKLWLFGAWIFLMAGAPADPDLWGHVRFGQDLLASHTITRVDPYSFTSDRPWINHEWLSEAAMAAAFDALGVVGLNLLRLGIIALVLWLVWQRTAGLSRKYRPMLVAVAALGITLRALPVRPQLFSLLCFAAVLAIAVRAEDTRRDWPLAFIPPIFVAWVNLHGGWIVGLGTLALWTSACLVHRWRRRWWALPATVAAAAAATLINPYGVGMWTFIQSTVGLTRPMIGDWLPLYALSPALWLGWVVGAGLCVAAIRRGSRVPFPYIAVTLVLGIAAIRVSRLDAFFALCATFLLAGALPAEDERSRSHANGPPLLKIVAAISLAAVVIAATVRVRTIDIRETLMPERDAVDFVTERGLAGRYVTWFDWGQFITWHLSDRGVLVSMDGRRETVYTDTLIDEHMRFYFAGAGNAAGVDFARRLNADYVWLPRQAPVVAALRAGGWTPAFDGPVSVILQSPSRPAIAPRIVNATSRRWFPGP